MRTMRSTTGNVCLALWMGVTGFMQTGRAQTQPVETKSPEEVRTFFLTNVAEMQDAENILTALRNSLPRARAYYVPADGAVTIRGTEDDIAQAEKMISDLDRKRKVYRITYSITETDGDKAMGTQHVELVLPTGGTTIVKQGSRVPIVTGIVDKDSGTPREQVQYVDVGLNIEASLEGSGEALRLRSKVEQSNLGDGKTGLGTQDPIIQQTQLEGWSMLTQGRPALLGSLDIPGTTRHEEISVVSELVK